VDDIITVEEDEIIAAMRLVWERMKICIEPSAGVPVGWERGRGMQFLVV
jgi:threonine dehydratase